MYDLLSLLPPTELNSFISNLLHLKNNQRLNRLHNCLSRKSSSSCTYSKTFSPVKFSSPQSIITPEKLKDFIACQIEFTQPKLNCISSEFFRDNSKFCLSRISITSQPNCSETIPNCVLAEILSCCYTCVIPAGQWERTFFEIENLWVDTCLRIRRNKLYSGLVLSCRTSVRYEMISKILQLTIYRCGLCTDAIWMRLKIAFILPLTLKIAVDFK